MQVRLEVKKLVDTPQERVVQFRLLCAESERELYATSSTESRKGLRTWDQAGIYAARRRIRAWISRHSATLV